MDPPDSFKKSNVFANQPDSTKRRAQLDHVVWDPVLCRLTRRDQSFSGLDEPPQTKSTLDAISEDIKVSMPKVNSPCEPQNLPVSRVELSRDDHDATGLHAYLESIALNVRVSLPVAEHFARNGPKTIMKAKFSASQPPTQKPQKLLENLLLDSVKPGSRVASSMVPTPSTSGAKDSPAISGVQDILHLTDDVPSKNGVSNQISVNLKSPGDASHLATVSTTSDAVHIKGRKRIDTEKAASPQNNQNHTVETMSNINNTPKPKWPTAEEVRLNKHETSFAPKKLQSVDPWEVLSVFGPDAAKKILECGDNQQDLDGYALADWDGNWAPPPIDWEERVNRHDFSYKARVDDWDRLLDLTTPRRICDEDLFSDGCLPIALREWIPTSIDDVDAEAWWSDHIADLRRDFSGPFDTVKITYPNHWKDKLLDPDDFTDTRPWWSTYINATTDLLEKLHVPEASCAECPTGRFPPQTLSTELQIIRWRSHQKHQAARRERNREKREARNANALLATPADMTNEGLAYQMPQLLKPSVHIHIRPARDTDIPELLRIYNFYVRNTTIVPELADLNATQMRHHLHDIASASLPFIVAVDLSSSSQRRTFKRGYGEPLVGFAHADDYHNMNSCFRFLVELDVYVDPRYYRHGIGSCLMDRLLLICDAQHDIKTDCDWVNDSPRWDRGGARNLGSMIVSILHETPARREAMTKWLTKWGFKHIGDLENVARREGWRRDDPKVVKVSQSLFLKMTGTILPTVDGV